jgi:hypothetical protein
MHMLAEMVDTLVLVVRAGLTPRVVVESRSNNRRGKQRLHHSERARAGSSFLHAGLYEYLSEKMEVVPNDHPAGFCLVHLVYLVYLVCLVHRVGLVQPNKRNRPNKPDRRDRPNRPNEQDLVRKHCHTL